MNCIFWKLKLQITATVFGLFTQPVLYIHQGDQKNEVWVKIVFIYFEVGVWLL